MENVVTILQVDEGKISFVDTDEIAFSEQQSEFMRILKDMLVSQTSIEDCIERLHTLENQFIVSLKTNFVLLEKVLEHLNTMTKMEDGERVFFFCSQECFVAEDDVENLKDSGYLLTDRRILFWKKEEVTSLPISEIHSLSLNIKSDLWCLNDSESYPVSSVRCSNEQLALLYIVILFRASLPESQKKTALPEKKVQVSEKMVAMSGEKPQPEGKSTSQAADKLREVKRLFEEGLISEQEYAGIKEKILKDAKLESVSCGHKFAAVETKSPVKDAYEQSTEKTEDEITKSAGGGTVLAVILLIVIPFCLIVALLIDSSILEDTKNWVSSTIASFQEDSKYEQKYVHLKEDYGLTKEEIEENVSWYYRAWYADLADAYAENMENEEGKWFEINKHQIVPSNEEAIDYEITKINQEKKGAVFRINIKWSGGTAQITP